MKKLFFAAALILLFFSACSSRPVILDYCSFKPSTPDAQSNYPLEPMSDKTAMEYLADGKILVGINMGNTFDAWGKNGAEVLSGEEVNWGNPQFNQEIFIGIKEAGFDMVRLPITWMGHMGPGPDYKISESYLKRISEVAVYAHNAGLKVIINIHHDGSCEKKGNTVVDNGWLSINRARVSQAEYDKVTFQFARTWQQISAYFMNFGDWLIFEPFNELHDGGWGWSPESQQRPQYDIINQWNQIFTMIVRESGANNANRYLLIPGYVSSPKHTLADYFVLPVDSAADRQIVTFHYYDPWEFGIAGTRSEWGTDADKIKVDRDFAPFKAKFVDNKIPVIIGESGAVKQLFPGDKAKESSAARDRLDYLAHVFGKANQYGLIPVYWDNGSISGNGEKFGLFNRSTGKANSDESKAIIEAMISAVKK